MSGLLAAVKADPHLLAGVAAVVLATAVYVRFVAHEDRRAQIEHEARMRWLNIDRTGVGADDDAIDAKDQHL